LARNQAFAESASEVPFRLALPTSAPDTGRKTAKTLSDNIGLFSDERAMSNIEIRNLLVKLRDQIQQAEIDAETRTLMQELDSDIHGLLDSERDAAEKASVMKKAREFEANFETEHPVAVRILSEVMEALARMGI